MHLMNLKSALQISAVALGVNLTLAAIKITGGIVGHSQALIADGIESVADVISTLILLGGLHLSVKPADENHPFGHGKAEPIAGILICLLLLVAAGWIAYQSVNEILTPSRPPEPFTLLILIAVIVIKELLSRSALATADAIESTALRGDAWHHRSDALTSAAAFLGISISILGGPEFATADDWAALAACTIIAWNGMRIFRTVFDEMMDASVSADLIEKVRQIAGRVEGVRAIEKTRIRKTGLHHSMDIHVIVDGNLTVSEGHEIAHTVKDALQDSPYRINDVTVHIEPDHFTAGNRGGH